MDLFLNLIQTIGGFSSGASGLITLALVFMYMIDRGWIKIGKNGNGNGNGNGNYKALLDQMNVLKEHYNDETTQLLREIRDGIKDLTRIHENYEKIGIKTRDCPPS